MAIRTSFTAPIILSLGAAAIALNMGPLSAFTSDAEAEFPENLAAGVLYATIDRADLKQYRELYAPAAAIAALKEGKPLPRGTVLTMLVYAAKRDATGKPITDENGRFMKDELVGYLVMEKRRDEDAPRTSGALAGKWDFRSFTADKRINANAKLTDCAECHQKRRDHDFVFTGDRMKTSHRTSDN